MPIKTSTPNTAGRRRYSVLTYEEITKTEPEKRLRVMMKEHAGRNNQGRLTVRHRGAGNKRYYRMIDFRQTEKMGIPGKVSAIEYDPYRSAFIMLVTYVDGDKRYHIAPEGMKVGDSVMTKARAKAKTGNRMVLKNIPVGFEIHNLEVTIGRGGQLVRSAGGSARLVSLEGPYAHIEMPSKEIRFIHKECYATIGKVSNPDHFNVSIGKAGRNRHKRQRPEVRGKVMNPVDHPHGGGEGRNPIGLPGPRTPWGKPALGFKTRKRKLASNRMIIRTRKGRTLIKLAS